MNFILLFESDFIRPNTVRLTDRRLGHVINVLNPSPGDQLSIGLLNGPAGRGTVIDLTTEALEMDVAFDRQAPAPLPVTLILALPRPKMLRRVLFAASSMGVKKIYLINAARVEKSFWKSPLLSEERTRECLFLGLEQACDTNMSTRASTLRLLNGNHHVLNGLWATRLVRRNHEGRGAGDHA